MKKTHIKVKKGEFRKKKLTSSINKTRTKFSGSLFTQKIRGVFSGLKKVFNKLTSPFKKLAEKLSKNSVFVKLSRPLRKFKIIYVSFVQSRYFNFVLIILFILSLYLVIYPFAPAVIYKLFYEGRPLQLDEITALKYTQSSRQEDGKVSKNRLVIPKIHVDMAIVEGSTENSLNLGVWHRPNTGYPTSGNMVLTGHRVGYAFLPDDVKTSTSFYNLDKLENGDELDIFWKGTQYKYEVTGHEIVEPTAVYIEQNTKEEKLTLYTCHPVGSNSHRLVYYAKRIQ